MADKEAVKRVLERQKLAIIEKIAIAECYLKNAGTSFRLSTADRKEFTDGIKEDKELLTLINRMLASQRTMPDKKFAEEIRFAKSVESTNVKLRADLAKYGLTP